MAQQASPATKKFLGVIFTFAALVMLYFSWHTYNATNEFLETAQSAPGIVVDFDTRHSSSSSSSGSSTTYAPIVEYTHPETGQTIRFTSSASSNPPAFDGGEEVTVLYSPDDPEDARIDSFMSLWMMPLILVVLGGIFLPVGLGIMRSKNSQQSV